MNELKSFFHGKNVLITGGTGSFGQAFCRQLITQFSVGKLVVFSRDEWKQWQMRQDNTCFQHDKMRYFLGDVRDKERLRRAFHGIDIVIHAAALKQVATAEYNPVEFVKTNIQGAMNVIEAAIDAKVSHVIALSTDKAVNPSNLYGATKLCSDKLFVSGNVYVDKEKTTKFSVVRYGNVLGSRGSIIPKWLTLINYGATELPITHLEMTRFWISLEKAVSFVLESCMYMEGGEIFIPKIPSMRIVDLAEALQPGIEKKVIGLCPGEKIHELLLSVEDARSSLELEDRFIILNHVVMKNSSSWLKKGTFVAQEFEYASHTNTDWLDIPFIRSLCGIMI
jgi:UDP-N-acetylglucosamine 4,6-dehydratase/5-epimerase